MADNFPIQNENKTNFISSPLAVDLNNDNAADIITFTEDGCGISGDEETDSRIQRLIPNL